MAQEEYSAVRKKFSSIRKQKGLGLKEKFFSAIKVDLPKKVFTKHEGWNFSDFVDLKKQLNQ